ncbi:MAG: prephenate dehydrogenase/arogenate dehydrogenase family protein [Candidatus Thorarchaeota archaeon]
MRTAVIGGAGGMGKLLVEHFLGLGHSVIVSDPKSIDTKNRVEFTSNNTIAVKDADLVVISVPMDLTTQIVQEVTPFMNENSILCEIATLKSNIVEELKTLGNLGIQPLSIHPLFGPSSEDLRKKYALIPVLDMRREKDLANALFPDSQIIVIESSEHDRFMALTLSLPYFANIILASVLKDEDFTLIEQLSGTTFAIQFMLSMSIMSHSSEFQLALQTENQNSIGVLKAFQTRFAEELSQLENDPIAFQKSYRKTKSQLEEKLVLEQKYQDMYRILKVLEEEVEERS